VRFGMVAIKLENIRHVYPGNVEAVKGVTITFEDKTFSALLGPSGCGKTTLMKIIAGLLKPTAGRVYFDNEDVTDLSPQERNIAMVFQFPVVYDMSVYDNLAFPLIVRKLPKDEVRRKVNEVAELLELKDKLHLHASALDAGGRQRVAIGRALVRSPNAFILDEPFTNIDPASRLVLRAKIKEIQKELKQTMIFVTHDQAEALTLSDWIAVMNEGRILQYDTPETIYDNPANTFVAYFIGIPAMNLVDCSLEDGKLISGEFVHDVSNVAEILRAHGTEFILGIRAEHLEVSTEERPKPEWVRMKCAMIESLGALYLLHLEGGGIYLKAKTKRMKISEGNYVWVRMKKEKIRVFDKKTGERII